ncbi:unnamed protein product, partial [marine sediment metagenome]
RGLIARAEFYRVRGERERGDKREGEDDSFELAERDLTEALEIAERGEMRLFQADAHLEYARLYLATPDQPAARAHLAQAKQIIEETGYHRCDEAVAELEAQLA